MDEFIIRRELGGFYPDDPIKADFFTGLISIKNKKYRTNNNMQHLQDLIRKNS